MTDDKRTKADLLAERDQAVLMIEHRRTKAGDLSHWDIACHVSVTTTTGLQLRDVLVGIVYGAESAMRDDFGGSFTPAPETPNVLLAFKNATPDNAFQRINLGRYFQVAADSIATIYREETPVE